MEIKFHSTVIMTEEFEQMKSFYQNILQQKIEFDVDNCIGFKNGLSLWKLKEEYPIAKNLGRTFDKSGNKNLEICFETVKRFRNQGMSAEEVSKKISVPIQMVNEVCQEN